MTARSSEWIWPAVAVLGLVCAAAGLWSSPPAGHDAYHHAMGGVEHLRAWKLGDLWPRFQRDLNGGTGSFLPAIYSQVVPLLDGLLCRLVGEGTRAIGMSMVLALAAGAFLLRSLVDQPRRSVTLLWLLLPYPVTALTARATVTELWGLAAACGTLVLALPPGPRGAWRGALTAVFAALVCGTQPVMLPLVGVSLVAAWLSQRRPVLLGEGVRTAAWVAAGTVTGAPFWLPAVVHAGHLDIENLTTGPYGWRSHMLPAAGGIGDLEPLLTAVAATLALVAIGSLLLTGVRRDPRSRGLAVATLAGVVMATPLSGPVWSLGWLDGVQFPWRFLGPAGVTALLLAARLPRRRWPAMCCLLLPLVFVPFELDGGDPPLDPAMTRAQLGRAAAARYGIVPTLPSMPGMYAPGFHPVRSLRALEEQAVEWFPADESASGRSYDVVVGAAGPVLIPTQWWPEWTVEVDGCSIPYRNERGMLQVVLEEGEHRVSLTLSDCAARRGGLALGAVGVAMLLVLAAVDRNRNRDFRRPAGDRGEDRFRP